jgi:hypothetical protein
MKNFWYYEVGKGWRLSIEPKTKAELANELLFKTGDN